jgi:hypothetical protein
VIGWGSPPVARAPGGRYPQQTKRAEFVTYREASVAVDPAQWHWARGRRCHERRRPRTSMWGAALGVRPSPRIPPHTAPSQNAEAQTRGVPRSRPHAGHGTLLPAGRQRRDVPVGAVRRRRQAAAPSAPSHGRHDAAGPASARRRFGVGLSSPGRPGSAPPGTRPSLQPGVCVAKGTNV